MLGSANSRRDGHCHAKDGRDRSDSTYQSTVSEDCRGWTLWPAEGLQFLFDAKSRGFRNAVTELYDAIQRAVLGIDGKAVDLS